MISLICGISETKQMSKGEKISERQRDKQTLNYRNTQMVTRGRWAGDGRNR